jgi:hypothetical protein
VRDSDFPCPICVSLKMTQSSFVNLGVQTYFSRQICKSGLPCGAASTEEVRTSLHNTTGEIVGVSEILAQLDREIDQLEQARSLLTSGSTSTSLRGRAKKRRLTPEGRRRISEAVKRRWATERKAKTSIR